MFAGPLAKRLKECCALFEGAFRTNPEDPLSFALSDHFRMLIRDGKFYQRRYSLDACGSEVRALEQQITHVIGSGRHARSYLHLSGSGELTQLPVTWYTKKNDGE